MPALGSAEEPGTMEDSSVVGWSEYFCQRVIIGKLGMEMN